MSDREPTARPRQLTMAGWFVVAGSVLLVVTVFDTLTNLRSLDTRAEVARVLSSQSGGGLGLSVAQALSVMRVGLMVAGVCAAASGVLGFFVLQRHQGARIALSVIAVPILLTAPLTGILPGALVAAATVALWTGPARDWYAGRPVRQSVTPTPRADSPAAPPLPPPPPPTGVPPEVTAGPSGDEPSARPAPTPGFGARPGHPDPAAPPPWPPPGLSAMAAGWPPPLSAPAASESRPAQVTVACVLTWVFSGIVALLYLCFAIALLVAKDDVARLVTESPAWQRSNLRADMVVPVLWFGCLLFLGWSGGALVLAWFTWRRHNWARILLALSAGTALVTALFAFPFGIVHQVACAFAIASLFNTRSRAWFAAPPRHLPPPGPPRPPGW